MVTDEQAIDDLIVDPVKGTPITRMSLKPHFNRPGGIEIQCNEGEVQVIVENSDGDTAAIVFGANEFSTFSVGVLAILSEVDMK